MIITRIPISLRYKMPKQERKSNGTCSRPTDWTTIESFNPEQFYCDFYENYAALYICTTRGHLMWPTRVGQRPTIVGTHHDLLPVLADARNNPTTTKYDHGSRNCVKVQVKADFSLKQK